MKPGVSASAQQSEVSGRLGVKMGVSEVPRDVHVCVCVCVCVNAFYENVIILRSDAEAKTVMVAVGHTPSQARGEKKPHELCIYLLMTSCGTLGPEHAPQSN